MGVLMATVTITALAICSGGDHVRIELKVDGVEQLTKVYHVADLVDAVADVDKEDVIRTMIRLHKIGKTVAQVKTDLQAGLNVVV